MAQRRRKKKETITTAMVFLNVAIVAVIVIMITLIFLQLQSDNENKTKETSSSSDIVTTTEEVTTTETTTTSETNTTKESETEKTSEQETSGQETTAPLFTSYTNAFFQNDLFVGDSIATGFYLYGYLQKANVFAQVGLNPESAFSKEIDGNTLVGKVTAMKPTRIYIMLGSNGISFMDSDYMSKKISELVKKLNKASPDSEISVLTIPPVTKAHDQNEAEKLSDIIKYNDILREMCKKEGHKIIDVNKLLSNSEGYLAKDFAEADGMHFLGTAYAAVLSYIEDSCS